MGEREIGDQQSDEASGASDPSAARPMQLAYSELQDKMLDEPGRRRKAAKIVAVLRHFLGREDLGGLRLLDIGCSTGFIAEEMAKAGADVVGIDIDEPGLAKARERFGATVEFVRCSADQIPVPSKSVDIVLFNHIYEHVPDADAVMKEIRRVLKDTGVVYLGLGNRLGVIEPHYRLPFLSWLPKPAADRYVRAIGRADSYYETFRTRPSLRRMCAGLHVWDYTYSVLTSSASFAAEDLVPRRLRSAPLALWRGLSPIIPTFIWVGTPCANKPQGQHLPVPPTPL